MKKVLLLLLTLPFIMANAQIFINTNPNVKRTNGTIVTETKKVDETKTELKMTNSSEESPTIKTTTTITTKSDVNGTSSIKTESKKNNLSFGTVNSSNSKTTNTNSLTTTKSSNGNSNISGTTLRTTDTNTNTSSNYNSKSTYNTSSSSADVPPNAQPGKCYARCATEDQYTFKSKKIINSPKMVKRIKLPALYTTVYDTVIIKPQSTKTEKIPATYETIRQQKMVSPTTTKWVKGKADAGCLSADPKDCQVMCLVEVPAVYTTITKKVLKNEAYNRVITIPMEYKIVAKQIKTQNERYAEQVIPATYKTVQERVLVSKGGYQGWKEVLCGSDLTSSKIMAIQKALMNAGFNPGPIDNIFGTKTKEALKAYQKAKGLPVGNLNLETLKSLGV